MASARGFDLRLAAIGGLLLALAATAGAWHGRGPLRAWFVDAAADASRRHGDGPPASIRELLDREQRRGTEGIERTLAALGCACVCIVWLRRRGVAFARAPLAVPVCAAVLLAGAEFAAQCRHVPRALDYLAASDDALWDAFYPEASRAADAFDARVRSGANFLVIAFGDPEHVNVLGYRAFPRRMFMPPVAEFRLSADAFRSLYSTRADVRAECARRRLDYAVDVERLVAGDADGAIVDLRAARNASGSTDPTDPTDGEDGR